MNIDTPQKAVTYLREIGWKQGAIAEAVKALGVDASQVTISRIESGAILDPRFRISAALISLAQQELKRSAGKEVA